MPIVDHPLLPPCGSRPVARDHRAASGIGLVEVVIAVGLFGTLAAGVAHLFSVSARALVLARHRTSALILATDKMEQLRGAHPLRAPAPTDIEYFDARGRGLGRGGTPPSGTMYRRVSSVRRLARQEGVLVARVTVLATRSSAGGEGRHAALARDGARLVTLVAAGGTP